MARESVATQEVTRVGLVPVLDAPTVEGDVFDSGATILMVENVGAGAVTVTVVSPVTVDGLELEELTVSVAVGAQVLIGPFPKRTFGQPTSSSDAGRVYANYEPFADAVRAVVAL